MISQQHAVEKEKNRKILLHILSSIRFLARQGLPLQGDKDEEDSNFMQVLKLKAEENPSIGAWLLRSTMKHTCHQIQDEILKIMALQSLQNDKCFDLFWAKVASAADSMEVDEPQLPCHQRDLKGHQ